MFFPTRISAQLRTLLHNQVLARLPSNLARGFAHPLPLRNCAKATPLPRNFTPKPNSFAGQFGLRSALHSNKQNQLAFSLSMSSSGSNVTSECARRSLAIAAIEAGRAPTIEKKRQIESRPKLPFRLFGNDQLCIYRETERSITVRRAHDMKPIHTFMADGRKLSSTFVGPRFVCVGFDEPKTDSIECNSALCCESTHPRVIPPIEA
jgi:hypothetical protein